MIEGDENMKKNKATDLATIDAHSQHQTIVPTEREGYFKEGRDKLGRPYEKKLDSNGLYTKKEVLKDGTQKITLKKKP